MALSMPPPIHILGLGNLGRLFAHALATQANAPPIVLLFHRSSMLAEWDAANREIQITTSCTCSASSNYEVEVIRSPHDPGAKTSPIRNLIVTTKATHTLSALRPLAHRLDAQSSLLLAQNGLGTFPELNTTLFPSPAQRPAYLSAITSHGVYSTGPFRSVHAGLASITLGPSIAPQTPSPSPSPSPTQARQPPRPQDAHQPPAQSQYLISHLLLAPILSATSVPSGELHHQQLEKLTINAVINPLTTILRLKNGQLLDPGSPAIRALMRRLVEECSRILLALCDARPGSQEAERFSPRRLEGKVVDAARTTAANTSSMLQDADAGRRTEIAYINGYLVRRAEELGVECKLNEVLLGLVGEGKRVHVGDLGEWFPGVG
ncbi:2-dehydropantoate 2-reductase [Marssonina coronariae]|uniref:2-dehydropantoate 2-reductase n=1 Tax=Diplocarpon coronariae TaxID=2795749 RepID=A0A218Z8W0_9HELO|nr:2-dehydropantoate 2-reductase [Marssonina coronariae]